MKCETCGYRKAECVAAGNLLCGFCAADAVETGALDENEILDPIYQSKRIKKEYKDRKDILNYFFPKPVKIPVAHLDPKYKLPKCFYCGKPNERKSSNWCCEDCRQKSRAEKEKERREWDREQAHYHNFLFQM